MASANIFFTKLSKFRGDLSEDLNTWLREFERCCIITNKHEPEVKGQFLMLCVEGRAKAILEKLEADEGEPQDYDILVNKLVEVFDNTTSREAKMTLFETRILKIGETEDEFMLDLVKLYRNANPNAPEITIDTAIKRKFLQGIPPSLKRNIFIFCNDPYNANVTRDQLLAACRSAKDLLSSDNQNHACSVISDGNKEKNDISDIITSIKNLSLQLETHVATTNEKINENSQHIAAITRDFESNPRKRDVAPFSPRRNFRGNFNYRGSRFSSNQERRSYPTDERTITCFKCGGKNHYAKHCLHRSSGNE